MDEKQIQELEAIVAEVKKTKAQEQLELEGFIVLPSGIILPKG